jgi:hypothetical protein
MLGVIPFGRLEINRITLGSWRSRFEKSPQATDKDRLPLK